MREIQQILRELEQPLSPARMGRRQKTAAFSPWQAQKTGRTPKGFSFRFFARLNIF